MPPPSTCLFESKRVRAIDVAHEELAAVLTLTPASDHGYAGTVREAVPPGVPQAEVAVAGALRVHRVALRVARHDGGRRCAEEADRERAQPPCGLGIHGQPAPGWTVSVATSAPACPSTNPATNHWPDTSPVEVVVNVNA